MTIGILVVRLVMEKYEKNLCIFLSLVRRFLASVSDS
jgi:hypothetical protein